MATGGGIKKALGTHAVAAVMALNSAQGQDLRQMGGDGPTSMTDDSSLAITRPSPLDLPARSTMEAKNGENGAPSMLAEMQAQRRRESKMRETAEQFSGAPAIPTVEAPQEAQSTGGAAERPKQTEEEEPEEATEAEETAGIMSTMDSERALETIGLERRATIAQMIATQSAADATAHRQKEVAKIYNAVTDINGFAAFSPVNFLTYITLANAMLFNEISFENYDRIPKPTLVDKFRTIFADIIMVLFMPSCFTCFIFTAILAGAIFGTWSLVTNLLGG